MLLGRGFREGVEERWKDGAGKGLCPQHWGGDLGDGKEKADISTALYVPFDLAMMLDTKETSIIETAGWREELQLRARRFLFFFMRNRAMVFLLGSGSKVCTVMIKAKQRLLRF